MFERELNGGWGMVLLTAIGGATMCALTLIVYLLGEPTDPRVDFIKYCKNTSERRDEITAVQYCADAAAKIDWSQK